MLGTLCSCCSEKVIPLRLVTWVLENSSPTSIERLSVKKKKKKMQTASMRFSLGKNKKSPRWKKEKEEEEEEQDDDKGFSLDDDSDDDEATKIIAEKAAAAAKSKEKGGEGGKKVIAKSTLVLDVKPQDSETDLGEMEKKIRSIQQEGLLWGACDRKPVAYGIYELRIVAVVVDDLVSTDSIQEQIESFPEVQSTDIHAFNKI